MVLEHREHWRWLGLGPCAVALAACGPPSGAVSPAGTTDAPASLPSLSAPASAAPAATGAGNAQSAPEAPPTDMVLVAAGSFLRGSPPGVGLEDEHPQRTIELGAFYIDRTEVRQSDFARCVTAGACPAPHCKDDRPTDWDPTKRAEHPVVCIDWASAQAYCQWAHKRLPTEAEWEKAARGSDGRLYPWGNEAPTCERANYQECGRKDTLPAGSLPKGASPFGALDMAGNVWEWVADWHLSSYYVASPAKNPEGPFSGEARVVRGGAFKYGATELSSAGRTYDEPTIHYEHVGVRCAKSAR